MLRSYYQGLTKQEFGGWSLFDLDDALTAMTHRVYRDSHAAYQLLHAVLSMFRSKDSPPIEFQDLLAGFANPFKKAGAGSNPYHPEFRRLMRVFVDSGYAEPWMLSSFKLDAIYEKD